jgi:hypothetical protein
MDLLDQRARLKAGDEEHHPFDQINEKVPEKDALQTRRRRDQERTLPAHIEPRRDGREHAGAAKMFRNPIGEIGRHQRQRDLDARLAHPAAQPQAEPADANAIGNLADDD